MKYTTSIVGFMLALNGVMAAPVPEPAVKVVVVTKDVIQTVQYTSTVWVPPSGPAPTDSAYDNKDSDHKKGDKKKHKPSKSDLPTDALSSAIESAMTTDTDSTSLPTPTTTSTESSETESSTTESSTTEEHTSTTETPTSTQVPTTTQAPTTTTAEPLTTTLSLTPTTSTLAALPSKIISTLDKATGGLLSNVGEATFYATGLGSCGMVSTDSDLIAAISYVRMDAVNSGNTNNNPLCGKQVKATYNGGPPVVITIVDRCPACGPDDLDLSPEAFKQLGAHPDDGRVKFSWDWL